MGQRGAARSSRGGRRRARRRSPFARALLIAGPLAVLALIAGGLLAARNGDLADTADAGSAPETVRAAPPPPSPTPSPSPSVTKTKTKTKPKVTPKKTTVPASGPGTFTSATLHGDAVGSGPLHRYRVLVEDGSGVDANQAATEIQTILANPRSWAAHGRGTFQLVSSGADFVFRIATPSTADQLCLQSLGVHTHGELNCEISDGVVVNLRRWQLGSPQFAGPPAQYRHLIINHEVGHAIGYHSHMACPGAGKPAPVMQQQIKGLDGCRSNAFPYDENGTLVTGPTVP
ncbi:DUF3152 domain-containing protein [Streptomyces sp. NPDC050738]|uniref:DUF3152 domain-containing protein n=1 Tax=Streptomyces sp. NPDC050738 TaxID=3154744 RepID=UPI0034368A48